MKTAGKVIDGAVIVGSIAVGIGAGIGIVSGIKNKKVGAITLSALTLMIGIYALKEAVTKINE